VTEVGEIDVFDLSGSMVTRNAIVGKLKDYIYESVYITRVPWGGLLQVWREVDGPKYEFEDDPAIIFHPDHKVWRVVNHLSLQLEDGDAPGMLSYTEQEDEDAGAPGIVNAQSRMMWIVMHQDVYNTLPRKS
jgi:hypothetical protein